MTKILIDKETVELALEALKDVIMQVKYYEQGTTAINALFKALEQSTEQEPVAWVGFNDRGECREIFTRDMKNTFPNYPTSDMTPLYTQPQEAAPRKPLTDEQILDVNMSTVTKVIDEPIICDTDHNIIHFARAIEAAHGIKGEA